MTNAIVLSWLDVENANAVAGLTWGFPAITHFLGYTHALSRKLQLSHGLRLEGCAVICHHHQRHAYSSGSSGRDYQFALTRNPLTREGKTASFNEEGRMYLTVSLILECHGEIPNGDVGKRELATHLHTLCQTQKLAGGSITRLRNVQVCSLNALAPLFFELMPGFALLDRSDLLAEHYQQIKQEKADAEMLDAWLDFAALKMAAEKEGEAVTWRWQKKPQPGFLVPLMTGWQRISPLYEPGTVNHARDAQTPFCFTEAVYGIGEWRGVHRIQDLSTLFWRYSTTETGYYCRGQSLPADIQEDDDIFDTY